jgi:hypothetical protein
MWRICSEYKEMSSILDDSRSESIRKAIQVRKRENFQKPYCRDRAKYYDSQSEEM